MQVVIERQKGHRLAGDTKKIILARHLAATRIHSISIYC